MVSDDLKEDIKIKGEDLIKRIKALIKEGNIRRIIIKDEKGKVFLEIPLTIGVAGVIIAGPMWAAIGALAAMVSKFQITIIRTID